MILPMGMLHEWRQSYVRPELEFVGGKTFVAAPQGAVPSYNISLSGLSGGIGSSLQEGDVVVVAVTLSVDSTRTTTIAGYTKIEDKYANSSAAYDCTHSLHYKIMGPVPDSFVVVPAMNTSSNGSAYAIMVLRGIDPNNPLDVTTPAPTVLTNSAQPNPPSITTRTADAVIIASGGDNVGLTSYGATGFDQFITDHSSVWMYDVAIGMGLKAMPVPGTFDPPQWTGNGVTSGRSSVGITAAFRRVADPNAPKEIEFIAANTSASQAASLTSPAHQVGDLIVAVLISTTTVKTLPAPWVLSGTSPGAGSYRHAIYYKIAEGTSEVITPQGAGTLQFIGCFVYRNAISVGTPAFDVASTFTYPALSLNANGKSWVASFAWDIFGGVANEYPVGSTFRVQNPDTNKYFALFDTNSPVSSWPATSPHTQPNAGVGQAVGCFEIIAPGAALPKKIEYISINNGGSVTSLALPTHQPGDLIVMLCDGTSAPTVPSGWTEWSRLSTYTNKSVIAYKVAASASEVSGTWANAYALSALVYRNATPGAEATAGASGTGTTNWPALTLQDSSGTSVVLHFGAAQATTAGPTLAAGDTNRPGPTSNYHKTSDTNDGVTSMPAKPNSVQGISLHTLELKLVP